MQNTKRDITEIYDYEDVSSDSEDTCVGNAYTDFIASIGDKEVLERSEVERLFSAWREHGDEEARRKLLEHNIKLVINIAKRYNSSVQNMEPLDLVQEGFIGLMRTLETYDPSRAAISTYATHWIKQKVERGIQEKDNIIKKPVHVLEKVLRINRAIDARIKETGERPTDEELAEILHMDIQTVKNTLQVMALEPISLNMAVGEEEDSELVNFVPSDTDVYQESMRRISDRELLLVLKEVLRERYYYVLYARIFAHPTLKLQTIGDKLGVTRERIRQLEKKALSKARKYLGEDNILRKMKIREIAEREDRNIRYLKDEPITPEQISAYLYIKDELNPIDRKVLYIHLLGKYDSHEINASLLGMDLNEYVKRLKLSMLKLKRKLKSKEDFNKYRKMIAKRYGTKLYTFDLASFKELDYRILHDRFCSLSYDELIGEIEEFSLEITPKERKLLALFWASLENPQVELNGKKKSHVYRILGRLQDTKMRKSSVQYVL